MCYSLPLASDMTDTEATAEAELREWASGQKLTMKTVDLFVKERFITLTGWRQFVQNEDLMWPQQKLLLSAIQHCSNPTKLIPQPCAESTENYSRSMVFAGALISPTCTQCNWPHHAPHNGSPSGPGFAHAKPPSEVYPLAQSQQTVEPSVKCTTPTMAVATLTANMCTLVALKLTQPRLILRVKLMPVVFYTPLT